MRIGKCQAPVLQKIMIGSPATGNLRLGRSSRPCGNRRSPEIRSPVILQVPAHRNRGRRRISCIRRCEMSFQKRVSRSSPRRHLGESQRPQLTIGPKMITAEIGDQAVHGTQARRGAMEKIGAPRGQQTRLVTHCEFFYVLSEGCCFLFSSGCNHRSKTPDIPPPPFAESSPLSTRAVSTLHSVVAAVVCCTLPGVRWVHAGKCCRPHFTGRVYILHVFCLVRKQSPDFIVQRTFELYYILCRLLDRLKTWKNNMSSQLAL